MRNAADTIASWMCGQPIDNVGDRFLMVRAQLHEAFEIEGDHETLCNMYWQEWYVLTPVYMSSDERTNKYVRCQMTRRTR